MTEYPSMKELYLGCECMSLEHISQFIHFPPVKDGSKCVMEEDEPSIYLSVKTNNYYRNLLFPIIYIFDKYEWQSFFAYNWYKRIWIAGKYIVNPLSRQKWGILDAFDFQDKDLEKLDAFMALISSNIDTNITQNSELWIDEDWPIVFSPTRLEFEKHNIKEPWQVGWEIQFKKRGFLGRVKYAFKYIFGSSNQEQNYPLCEKDASKIRGMIKWVQDTNEKDRNAKKD